MKENTEIVQVRVDEIVPNRFQPRLTFNEEEIKDLSESIKMHGVIQPLVLRRLGDKYEIIAGERRYKAATMAGLQTVPAIIVVMDDKESAEVALVENLQRKDLTAIEEAQSYKKILDMGYLTQEELATRMGVSQPNISNKLRLLNLAIPVKEALLANKISERHARSLLNITDSNTQISMLNRIINERLTVRQTDDEINKLLGRSSSSFEKPLDIDINELKESSQNIIAEHKPSDLDLLLKSQDDINKEPSPSVVEEPTSFEEPNKLPEDNIFENPKTSFDNFNQVPEEKLESLDNNVEGVSEMPINPFMSDTFTNIDEQMPNDISTKEEEKPDESASPIFNDVPNVESTPSFDPMPSFENPASSPVENAPLESASPEIMDFGVENKVEESNIFDAPSFESTPSKNITTAISSARDAIRNLSNQGFKVDSEEFDFEDMYEIVIKIKKD